MEGAQPQILICHVNGSRALLGSISHVLRKNGYLPQDTNGKTGFKTAAADITHSAAIILIIDSALKGAESLDLLLSACRRGAVRLIGIWSPGAKDEHLPDQFAYYGNALMCWIPEELISVIKGKMIWENSECKQPDERQISHLGC
ncbi:MAG: hypothetical protein HQL40_06735 [Alphaproteobacteria bacterium]|nr:hypothetical protein [Alphaproteobacteria bacterium]